MSAARLEDLEMFSSEYRNKNHDHDDYYYYYYYYYLNRAISIRGHKITKKR